MDAVLIFRRREAPAISMRLVTEAPRTNDSFLPIASEGTVLLASVARILFVLAFITEFSFLISFEANPPGLGQPDARYVFGGCKRKRYARAGRQGLNL